VVPSSYFLNSYVLVFSVGRLSFGGAGTNVLTGGTGADEFQFTRTSQDTSVTDFDVSQGDTLRFYNTGGAEFNKGSIATNTAGDVALRLTIRMTIKPTAWISHLA
jgi:Ca2+-binding RTX toxin-like protein